MPATDPGSSLLYSVPMRIPPIVLFSDGAVALFAALPLGTTIGIGPTLIPASIDVILPAG